MKSPIVKRPVKETTERRISATLRIALVLVLLVVNVAAVVLLSYFLQARHCSDHPHRGGGHCCGYQYPEQFLQCQL